MTSAEDAVRSIAEGIADIKKDRGSITESEVLGRYRFGSKVGPMVMRIGGSPTLNFDKAEPKSSVDRKSSYLVRMAITDAEFQNVSTKEVCIERASFFSEVTPGAEFALTYEIMDYCFDNGDKENKCIRFLPKGKILFIFPYFDSCSKIPPTEPDQQAKCMCKAIQLKGSMSKLNATTTAVNNRSTSNNTSTSTGTQPTSSIPSSSSDTSVCLPNIHFLFILAWLFFQRHN
ncbi:hypothetical protein DSO57_1004182 [Entomophthora muscae]|uniref:Uncharacterized protein n=1 Tax=Entomophthora muscae TaxID=34485 RepID=A0ACC2UTW2_9FUNG|nr:hypothetical protein DSO57_1004182 [Entomophthora muscae]